MEPGIALQNARKTRQVEDDRKEDDSGSKATVVKRSESTPLPKVLATQPMLGLAGQGKDRGRWRASLLNGENESSVMIVPARG
jgi:hypothetical protein